VSSNLTVPTLNALAKSLPKGGWVSRSSYLECTDNFSDPYCINNQTNKTGSKRVGLYADANSIKIHTKPMKKNASALKDNLEGEGTESNCS